MSQRMETIWWFMLLSFNYEINTW